jgi:hypothetical protein
MSSRVEERSTFAAVITAPVAVLDFVRVLPELVGGLRSLIAPGGPLSGLVELRDRLFRLTDDDGALSRLGNLEHLVDIRLALEQLVLAGGPLDRLADISATLERLAALEESLQKLGGLDESLRRLGALEESLQKLGALDDSLDRIAAVAASLERLADSTETLPALTEATAALPDLPARVRAVEERVIAIGQQLGTLQPTLDRLATSIGELEGSVGSLGRLADRVPGGGQRRRWFGSGSQAQGT